MITPGSANALLLADAGYQIQRSVRLRSSATASLTRTPSSASNRQTWTWSGWVKRGGLADTDKVLFDAGTGNSADLRILLTDTNFLYMLSYNGAAYDFEIKTTQVFRDPSAWYHFVVAFDTTQATASNRIKLYVNGAQITALSASTYPALNFSGYINSTSAHTLGKYAWTAGGYFDGYLTEVNFIDGQALTPASFGEINPVTGVWAAKKYAGTYGTNGFYLNFSDNSAATAAAIGKDSSGNGNNWTPSGVSVTAGVTYDSMLDVPLGAGGAERGNYAIWNPLGGSGVAVTDGNLKALNSATSYLGCFGSIALPSSGKIYFEAQLTANAGGSNIANFGIAPTNTSLSGNQVGATNSASMYCNTTISINGSDTVRGSVALATDVFQACYDAATGKVYLGINNTFYQSNGTSGGDPANGTNPSRTLTAGELAAWMFGYQIGWTINFGQRPFAYTPPTGFKALHTGNLPDAVIKLPAQYMACTLWTGNQAARTIDNSVNGVSFQPDLVWTKSRSDAENNRLSDSVRGGNGTVLYELNSNTTEADGTDTLVNGIASNGFTIAAGANSPNITSRTYVGWQWKAGGTAVSNTAGSITSSVSAGVSQGFSVVTYTGTGANATVGHGLGVAPKMVIVKQRSVAGNGWTIYNSNLTSASYVLNLNSTIAQTLSATNFNGTAPASSVFSVGTSANTNQNGETFVAYCFSEVAGFSKFGSYTGNGSADGPFVFLGFRPAFVLIKNASTGGIWYIWDNKRIIQANGDAGVLQPQSSEAEADYNASGIDLLSNGFKIRNTDTSDNNSGATIVYAAFAEHPFRNSLAR